MTDADRSEAADLLLIVGFSLEYIAETKAGSHDDHAFVQAFARHRLATQTPNAAALVSDALILSHARLRCALEQIVAKQGAMFCSGPDCTEYDHGRDEGLSTARDIARDALAHCADPSPSTPSNTQGALEADRDAVLEEGAKRADYEAELAQDNLNENYDIKSNRPALRVAKRIAFTIRALKSGEVGRGVR